MFDTTQFIAQEIKWDTYITGDHSKSKNPVKLIASAFGNQDVQNAQAEILRLRKALDDCEKLRL